MKIARRSFAGSCIALICLLGALAFLTVSVPSVHATGPTALTVQVAKPNNYAVVAGDLTLSFATCDNVNGNTFPSTGMEVLEVMNTDSSAHTFTVNSVPDALGRSDTSLTGYSVAAAVGAVPGMAFLQLNHANGWVSGGAITLACNSALLRFAVLRYN